MRRFLIRVAQAFTLAMIGTGFIADTSRAETRQEQQITCNQIGGQFVPEWNPITGTYDGGKYTCIYTPSGGGTNYMNCTASDSCTLTVCPKGERCYKFYPPKDAKDAGKKKLTTMTAGTTADRNGRTPGATTLGANSGLNAVAPSHTAPAVSTGAALNTQAVTGLAGIDKAAAISSSSLFSDRFNRMRR